MAELTDEEMLRYNRQIILRNFDLDGQEHLKSAHALIVGLGGLGCAAAQYLAASGVGHLSLLDFDTVALSNLQRQTLHHDADIGQLKVNSARDSLRTINPHIHITTHSCTLSGQQLHELIAEHDIVVDCTDNIEIRQQINLGCFAHKTPLVSGAAIRMEGQISVFTYQPNTPCYRCLSRLFGDTTLSCVEAGVMAPLVGVIGALQAMETLKVLTQFGTPATGKLLMYDAMTCHFRDIKLAPSPHCEVCGQAPRGE